MSGGQLTAVIIVLTIMIASVLRAALQGRHRALERREAELPQLEVRRMEEEMRALKDRVAVLERIATDRNHLLEQEFEKLRDS